MPNQVATHCCICGRKLTDAVSIERGIGPVCENRYLDEGTEAARSVANRLLYQASAIFRQVKSNQEAETQMRDIVSSLRQLGFAKVAGLLERKRLPKIEENAEVFIRYEEGHMFVKTPFHSKIVEDFRAIGRIWHNDTKENEFDSTYQAKTAVLEALRVRFAGRVALGPKGAFVL